jgi:hypothetical protein
MRLGKVQLGQCETWGAARVLTPRRPVCGARHGATVPWII